MGIKYSTTILREFCVAYASKIYQNPDDNLFTGRNKCTDTKCNKIKAEKAISIYVKNEV